MARLLTHWNVLALISATFVFAAPLSARAQEKINYQDHALPLFRNNCLNCHNPDKKKAGLDLSTYQGALAGSDNGAVINPGDPSNSKLFKVITHAEEPQMPPKKDKLPEKELDIVRKWIAGGALETANGKPAIVAKPKIDLSVVASAGKPKGVIAFPKGLSVDPVLRTQRAGAVVSMAASPWAPLVAVGGQKQILLYHTQTLDLLGVLSFPEGLPYVLRFSRNGSVLIAGGGVGAKSGKVVLFDVNTGSRLSEIGDEFDAVIAADISADQSVVALGGPNKVVKGYAVADGKLLYTIKKHTDWVTAIAFSASGEYLASADRAGGMAVWEPATGNEVFTLAGHKDGVTGLMFRDDSKVLASCSQDGNAKLWNLLDDGKELKNWSAHGNYTPPAGAVGAGTFNPAMGALSIAFTHDGRLVTCGRDKVVKAWDSNGGALKALDPPFADVALHAAFDCEGTRIIAGDYTGAVRVWNFADGKPAGELVLNPASVAERLDAACKKLVAQQPTLEKAIADFTAARDAAAKAAADVTAAQQASDGTKKAIADAETKAKATSDAATAALAAMKKAQTEADKAAEAAKTAQAAAAEAQKVVDKAQADAKAAADAIPKAKADADAAGKAIQPRIDAAKAAADKVAPAKKAADTAEAQLKDLRFGVAKLKVDQVASALAAAKKDLSVREAEQSAANEAVKAAQAASDKAAADAVAFEKGIPGAPARVTARQDASAKAKLAVGVAKNAADAAHEEIKQREPLVQQAADLSKNLAAASAKAKDNKALADAAERAKSSSDILAAELVTLKQTAVTRANEFKQAGDAQVAAEAALLKEKSDLDNAPKIVEAMKKAAADALADIPKKKAAADAAAKPIVEAKAKVDQIKADYEKLDKEARQFATPASVPATQPAKG